MKKIVLQLLIVVLFIFNSVLVFGENQKKDIYYFIEKAWENDSKIKQAKFDIEKYKKLKLEAISVYTPKVEGITWLAPMYTIKKTDDPWKTEQNFNQWGPYYNLDLQFQQPVFAFTRVISGIKAAQEGEKLAEADVEIMKWQVAKEIRLYYYGIVFGKTMLRTIDMADEVLSNAIKQAEESIAAGKTDISDVNLAQLKYFYTQIPINKSFALKSIEQAQKALFLSTGEKLADDDVPDRLQMELDELENLDYYVDLMFKHRPLLKKLNHGINATRHLMELEYKAMIPVLFVGGFLKYAAAPSVDMHQNSFMLQSYNTFGSDGRGVNGGIAVGFFWQFDPLKAVAKGLQKKAELDKLLELKQYAQDGFPVLLEKTLLDLKDLQVKISNLKDAIKFSQNWMFLAFNAYELGEGEARDIMEGLASFVKAKTDYYMAIYEYNKLLGELYETVGLDFVHLDIAD